MLDLLIHWVWRHPCPVCERSCWPTHDGTLRQYAAMRPRCPWRFHRRYARRLFAPARRI